MLKEAQHCDWNLEWTASCWLKVSGSSIKNRCRGNKTLKMVMVRIRCTEPHDKAFFRNSKRLKYKSSGSEGTMSPAECINQLDKWHMLLEKGANYFRAIPTTTGYNSWWYQKILELFLLGSYNMYIVMQEVLCPYIYPICICDKCVSLIHELQSWAVTLSNAALLLS